MWCCRSYSPGCHSFGKQTIWLGVLANSPPITKIANLICESLIILLVDWFHFANWCTLRPRLDLLDSGWLLVLGFFRCKLWTSIEVFVCLTAIDDAETLKWHGLNSANTDLLFKFGQLHSVRICCHRGCTLFICLLFLQHAERLGRLFQCLSCFIAAWCEHLWCLCSYRRWNLLQLLILVACRSHWSKPLWNLVAQRAIIITSWDCGSPLRWFNYTFVISFAIKGCSQALWGQVLRRSLASKPPLHCHSIHAPFVFIDDSWQTGHAARHIYRVLLLVIIRSIGIILTFISSALSLFITSALPTLNLVLSSKAAFTAGYCTPCVPSPLI